MSSEELTDLAGALRQLQPSADTLNRDRLMFQAGRASAGRGWAWPLTTAGSCLLNLGLGLALLWQPTPRLQLVEKPSPETPASRGRQPPDSRENPGADAPGSPAAAPVYSAPYSLDGPETAYHRLQEQISRWGLDAVPARPPAGPERPPMTVEGLFQELDRSSTTAPSAKKES